MSDENLGPDDDGKTRPVNDDADNDDTSNDDAAQNAHDENQRAANEDHKRKISDLFGDIDDGDDDVSIESLREERDELQEKVSGLETMLGSIRADNKELVKAAQDAKDAFENTKRKLNKQRSETLGKFVGDLQPVVATLQDGLKAIEAEKEGDAKFAKLVDGVSNTVTQLEGVFNKYAPRTGNTPTPTESIKNEPAAEPEKIEAPKDPANDTIDSLDLECEMLEKKMIDLGNALTRAQSDQQTLTRKLGETQASFQRDAAILEGEQKFAVEKFVKDLLPVLDTLDHGLQAIRKDKSGEAKYATLASGVEKTKEQLKGVFNNYGVSEINPINEAFDENKHEVITTQPKADVDPATVIFVHQKGYEVEGRVVRPAKVIVTPLD